MYGNNILDFQESTTILNANTKVWKLIECTTYIIGSFSAITSLRVRRMSRWICLVEVVTSRRGASHYKVLHLAGACSFLQRHRKTDPFSRSDNILMRNNFSLASGSSFLQACISYQKSIGKLFFLFFFCIYLFYFFLLPTKLKLTKVKDLSVASYLHILWGEQIDSCLSRGH